MKKVGLFIVLVLLAPLLIAVLYEGLFFLANYAGMFFLNMIGLGFALYLMMAFFILSGTLPKFVYHLSHEITHGATGLLLGHRIKSMHIDPVEGSYIHLTGRSNFLISLLISLAPYVIPLITILLLFVRAATKPALWPLMDLLIGASLAIHYSGLVRSLRRRQPDFTEVGTISALVLIVVSNVVVLLFFASYTSGDFDKLRECIQAIIARTFDLYRAATNAGTVQP